MERQVPARTAAAARVDEPGRRAPAPGRLSLVQAFLNTNDIEGGRDALATPADLGGWLVARRLLDEGAPVSPADHAWTLAVREALRDLIEGRDTGARSDDAVDVLQRAARDSDLRPALGPDGSRIAPGRAGVRGAVGQILAAVPSADASDAWRRLKVCRSDACRWVFYDSSRNRSGHWCTMSVCGNRMKARAYRARSRG